MIQRLRFAGVTGAPLAAVFHPPHPVGPDTGVRGGLLVVHCFTCSKDLHTMSRLARGLAGAGFAVLRFDFTGLGESGGDFAATTLSTNLGDLARAVACLQERGRGPIGLIGHSFGGAACLLAAGELGPVRSVAVIAAPSTAGHVRGLFKGMEAEIDRSGSAWVRIGDRPFPISAQFLDDLERHEVERRTAELGRPLLVLHPVDDKVIALTEGERIFIMARQPKAFVPLLGTDHLLTSRRASAQAVTILVDWFTRTLEAPGAGGR
jgi:alpha-beta hydrolase superfamily lysophospholipase